MKIFTQANIDALNSAKQIEGYFEQGYALAPLICDVSGAAEHGLDGIKTYLASMLHASQWGPNSLENHERDKGAIKWCLEQLGVLP